MPFKSDAQRKAVYSKLRKGQLYGKKYARKRVPVIIDYRNMAVYTKKGKKVGRFSPSKIIK